MRGSTVVTVMCVVAISAAGCGGGGARVAAPPSTSSTPSTSPSPSRSPSPSPSPEAVDVVPSLINAAGTPACGLYTWNDKQGPTTYTWVGFAVAVEPTGTTREVQVVYQIEDNTTQHKATFEAGQVRSGTSTTSGGTGAKYLSGSIGILTFDGLPANKLSTFLTKSRTITVTVDPNNSIKESNEGNNVLKLKVTPPGNKPSVAIKDNRCAKV